MNDAVSASTGPQTPVTGVIMSGGWVRTEPCVGDCGKMLRECEVCAEYDPEHPCPSGSWWCLECGLKAESRWRRFYLQYVKPRDFWHGVRTGIFLANVLALAVFGGITLSGWLREAGIRRSYLAKPRDTM